MRRVDGGGAAAAADGAGAAAGILGSGLPCARRVVNIIHPYDPISCAMLPARLPTPAFYPPPSLFLLSLFSPRSFLSHRTAPHPSPS